MFATNWMLTLFTRVVEFSLVYELWEIFLFERDRYLIFYFAVALLKANRQMLLQLTSMEKLLKYLAAELKITDFNQLSRVYYECITVRSNTPLSFPKVINKLGLFDPNIIISNEELELIESFKMNEQMIVYAKEIVSGLQLIANSNNNNKFLNMILL